LQKQFPPQFAAYAFRAQKKGTNIIGSNTLNMYFAQEMENQAVSIPFFGQNRAGMVCTMKSYTLKPWEIKLNDEYEVIIAGGGPAGCAAAIAAARRGAKTLLIEATYET
jgi:hypothetical protein